MLLGETYKRIILEKLIPFRRKMFCINKISVLQSCKLFQAGHQKKSLFTLGVITPFMYSQYFTISFFCPFMNSIYIKLLVYHLLYLFSFAENIHPCLTSFFYSSVQYLQYKCTTVYLFILQLTDMGVISIFRGPLITKLL